LGQGDAPLRKGDAPLRKGDAPLAKGDAPLAKGDAPLAKGDAPLAKGETPLGKGDTPRGKGATFPSFPPSSLREGAERTTERDTSSAEGDSLSPGVAALGRDDARYVAVPADFTFHSEREPAASGNFGARRALELTMRRGPNVHVTLRWGAAVVRTECVSASAPLMVGEGVWSVPDEAIGAARFALLSPASDGVRLELPARAQAWVSDGRAEPFRPAPAHLLAVGARARVELGEVSVDVDVEPASRAAERNRPRLAALLYPVASAILHAASIGILALWSPPLGADEPSAEEMSERTAFMMAALDAHAAPERDETRAHDDGAEHVRPGDADDPLRAGGIVTHSDGGGGARGNPTATGRGRGAAVVGHHDTPDPSAVRADAEREAAAFGILGVLGGPSASPDAPLATWGRDASPASDAAGARSPLFGSTIHDAFAWGAVGLSSAGEGGGASSGEIGMGSFGSLSHDVGQGVSFDRAVGFSTHIHRVTAPLVRMVTDSFTSVGRLPPDAIQRVVRQNAGRFRLCYQRGLEKQPSLRGRVVTRFLIARDGSVSVAADGGSDIADASVTACVTRTFTALSFPEPAGGTVAVIYPFMFDPE
jgi:hypothetical protein